MGLSLSLSVCISFHEIFRLPAVFLSADHPSSSFLLLTFKTQFNYSICHFEIILSWGTFSLSLSLSLSVSVSFYLCSLIYFYTYLKFCNPRPSLSISYTHSRSIFWSFSYDKFADVLHSLQTTLNPTRLHHNLADTCKQWLGELDNSGTKIYNSLTRTPNSSTMKAEVCHGCRGKPLKETVRDSDLVFFSPQKKTTTTFSHFLFLLQKIKYIIDL